MPAPTVDEFAHQRGEEALAKHSVVAAPDQIPLGGARWPVDTSCRIQSRVAMAPFAATGTFINLALFDLYYHFVAIMIVTREIVKAELERNVSGSVTPHVSAGALKGPS